MDAVTSAWSRLTHWLAVHAPEDLRQLRAPSRDDAWQDVLRVTAPDDLATFFRVQGGGTAAVLRFAVPLSVSEAVDDAIRRREGQAATAAWAIAQGWGGAPLEHDEGQVAGSRSWHWLPAFVPVAHDGLGNCLFVDTRPGPRHGCVAEYLHEEGALEEPLWSSVTAMLEDVADALEAGRPSGGWQPWLDADRLQWSPA